MSPRRNLKRAPKPTFKNTSPIARRTPRRGENSSSLDVPATPQTEPLGGQAETIVPSGPSFSSPTASQNPKQAKLLVKLKIKTTSLPGESQTAQKPTPGHFQLAQQPTQNDPKPVKEPTPPPTNTSITANSPTFHKILKAANFFGHFYVFAHPMELLEAIRQTPKINSTFLIAHQSEIFIFSQDFEEHTRHIKAVMGMLNRHGLKNDFIRMRIGMKSLEGAKIEMKPDWVEEFTYLREMEEEEINESGKAGEKSGETGETGRE